jgi:prevent-host-death family protein
MKLISHHELQEHSDEILQQAETGQEFTITVDGRPVAVLRPLQARQWVQKEEFLKILQAQGPDPTFLDDVQEFGGTLEDLS